MHFCLDLGTYVAILVPEHVVFKTEILLFKPFQDKMAVPWLLPYSLFS